jgi:hypothetical protein
VAIDVTIKDGRGSNGSIAVIEKTDLPSGAVVYTEPYRDVIGQTKASVNDTYGADMNKNHAFSGTPDGIHNGTDSVLWTASALSGTWDFASTTVAQAGTKSIDALATVNNSEAQLERGSTISTGAYTAMTGYIYITSWSSSGTKEVRVRNRLAGVDAGDILDLSNYIDTNTLGSWQKFSIPIADFNMGTVNIDQLVVTTIDIGGGAAPNYYLDTIQWEEAGGSVYTVEADAGSIYRVSTMQITLVDAYASTLADATHQKIPYNALLGVSALTAGINIKLTTDDEIRFNGLFKQHIDFVAFPGAIVQSGGDGTNTWVTYTINFTPPFTLDARTHDKLEVSLSDDLSGLLYMRILVRGSKEEVFLGSTVSSDI